MFLFQKLYTIYIYDLKTFIDTFFLNLFKTKIQHLRIFCYSSLNKNEQFLKRRNIHLNRDAKAVSIPPSPCHSLPQRLPCATIQSTERMTSMRSMCLTLFSPDE